MCEGGCVCVREGVCEAMYVCVSVFERVTKTFSIGIQIILSEVNIYCKSYTTNLTQKTAPNTTSLRKNKTKSI